MNRYIAAIKFITRGLLPQVRTDDTEFLRKQILSGNVPWDVVVAAGNQHLVVPALWVSLKERGLDGDLPDDLQTYLYELHKLNFERNRKLIIQIEEATEQLNRIGIEPVLLKGAAHLVGKGFHDIGARMMTDIDILVPECDIRRADIALKSIGYLEDEGFSQKRPDHHHLAPLFRKGDYAAIELHRRLLFSESEDVLDRESEWNNLESVRHAGMDLYLLNSDFRIMHNLVHSEITDRGYYRGQLPLRSLHETSVLVISDDCTVDWESLRGNLRSDRSRRIYDAYLYLLHRIFGVSIPGRIRIHPGNMLHYLRIYANIRWKMVFELDKKLQGYNAWEINRHYARKEKDLPLWRGRVRHTRVLVGEVLPFKRAKSLTGNRLTTTDRNDRN